jgi:formylglycine-generating enzyme required for sulfatase activity
MHGNVQECCADRFGSYPGGSVTDPTGASPDSGRVVLRGGSMNGDAGSCRSADRTTIDPDHRYGFVGFRAALVPIQ